jgi:hypothetical protein
VFLSPAEDDGRFDTPMHDTDATGTYSLEIHDYAGFSSQGPPPDPVPMTLRAFLLTGSPEEPAPASDLIPVDMKFVPVGELPEVLEVDITIDTTP